MCGIVFAAVSNMYSKQCWHLDKFILVHITVIDIRAVISCHAKVCYVGKSMICGQRFYNF